MSKFATWEYFKSGFKDIISVVDIWWTYINPSFEASDRDMDYVWVMICTPGYMDPYE